VSERAARLTWLLSLPYLQVLVASLLSRKN
jgi:hypothetical protein